MPEDKPTHPAFQAMAQPTRAEPRQDAPNEATPPPAAAPAAPAATSLLRKFGDPLDLVLHNGKKITMAEPPVATQFESNKILEAASAVGSDFSRIMVKSLMYIRAIDGRPITRPDDLVQARMLMNEIGDNGVDTVTNAYLQYFGLYGVKLPL